LKISKIVVSHRNLKIENKHLSKFCNIFLSPDNLPQSGGDDAKATGSSGPDNEVPKGDAKTTGKNTRFAPRAVVKTLGWTNKDEKKPDVTGELKSNEEFRNLLLKK